MQSSSGHSPGDDFWYEPLGVSTASGIRVSPESSMKLSIVYACIKVISEDIAKLPLHLYRDLPNGGKEKALNHPLYNVLHTKPNSFQTSFEWREMMQTHLLMRGNAYSEMIFSGLQVSELIPLNPDYVKIEILPNRSFRYIYKDPVTSRERIINRYSMLHIRGQSLHGLSGLNPIELQAQAIGLGLSMQEYNARFINNDSRVTNWIEFEGTFKDKEQKQRFRESWQEAQGAMRRNRLAVLEHGMKYNQVSINNRDAQYIETRINSDKEIARIYRIPPHKVGILDNATFSNIEQQAIEYVVDTLMPWVSRWEQAIMRDIVMEDDGVFVKFSMNGLLRGDSAARSGYYASGINTGWMTPNEARELEDMNPIDGLDMPRQQLNTTTVGGDNQNQQQNNQPQQDTQNARLMEIKHNAASRVVSKELLMLNREYEKALKSANIDAFKESIDNFYSTKHTEYVKSHLVISEQSAISYVSETKSAIIAAMNKEIEQSEPFIKALIEDWELNKADELAELT